MNCSRCPHMEQIKAALAPCQRCEAGRLHHESPVSNEAMDWAAASAVCKRDGRKADAAQTPTATNLSPDDEDALRKAMAELFDLDPIELLLVQHIMHGGSYASFNAPLVRLMGRLEPRSAELTGQKAGFRSLAHTWARSLAAKMPRISPVLRARIKLS